MSHIGPYQVEGELGRGAMGVVYKVRDSRTGKVGALKWLLENNDRLIKRFEQEGSILKFLAVHPHIINIWDLGTHSGRPYFVMELIEGSATLEDVMQKGSLNQDEILGCLIQIARALHFCHEAGVLHRDVKPSNILLDSSNKAYLSDFGVAKNKQGESLTLSGELVGTPSYMAPEQIDNDPTAMDRRVDVYALGAILYEVLCGVPPFTGASALTVLKKITLEEPAPIHMHSGVRNPALEELCLQSLAKDPKNRPASAEAFATRLEYYLRGDVQNAPLAPRKKTVNVFPILTALIMSALLSGLAVYLTDKSLSEKHDEVLWGAAVHELSYEVPLAGELLTELKSWRGREEGYPWKDHALTQHWILAKDFSKAKASLDLLPESPEKQALRAEYYRGQKDWNKLWPILQEDYQPLPWMTKEAGRRWLKIAEELDSEKRRRKTAQAYFYAGVELEQIDLETAADTYCKAGLIDIDVLVKKASAAKALNLAALEKLQSLALVKTIEAKTELLRKAKRDLYIARLTDPSRALPGAEWMRATREANLTKSLRPWIEVWKTQSRQPWNLVLDGLEREYSAEQLGRIDSHISSTYPKPWREIMDASSRLNAEHQYEFLKECVILRPELSFLWHKMGRVSRDKLLKVMEGARHMEVAAAIEDYPEVLFWAGEYNRILGRLEKSIRLLDRAVKRGEELKSKRFNPWHTYSLVLAFDQLAKPSYLTRQKDALDTLELKNEFSTNIELWKMRSRVYGKLGFTEKARDYKKRADSLKKS